MADKDKQKYVQMHEADIVRHQNQLADIRKMGYFLMEDGKRSNEVEAKIKGRCKNKSRHCHKVQEKLEEKLAKAKEFATEIKSKVQEKLASAKE